MDLKTIQDKIETVLETYVLDSVVDSSRRSPLLSVIRSHPAGRLSHISSGDLCVCLSVC